MLADEGVFRGWLLRVAALRTMAGTNAPQGIKQEKTVARLQRAVEHRIDLDAYDSFVAAYRPGT